MSHLHHLYPARNLCYPYLEMASSVRFRTLATAIGLTLIAGGLAWKGRASNEAAPGTGTEVRDRPDAANSGSPGHSVAPDDASDLAAGSKIRQRISRELSPRDREELEEKRAAVTDKLKSLRLEWSVDESTEQEPTRPTLTRIGVVAALRKMLQDVDGRLRPWETAGRPDAPVGTPGFIGVQLASDTPMRVMSVLADSPADHAMIFPGDEILAADGEDVSHYGYSEAYAAMQGDAGELLVLTVQPLGAAEPLELRIIRAPVPSQEALEKRTWLNR